jgi:integrase
MKKRWPGGRRSENRPSPTWRSLGKVYVPPEDKKDGKVEDGEVEETQQRDAVEMREEGALTLVEAREKARRWLDQLSRGIDPGAEAERVRAANRRRLMFAEARAEYIQHRWKRLGLAKASEAERLLTREFSAFDRRYADDIKSADVDEAVQVMVRRGAPAQARNALGYLKSFYNWLIDNPRYGIMESPAAKLRADRLIGEKRLGNRWLKDDELRAVWNAAGDDFGPAAPAIRLLIISAKRLNEIVQLSWPEIDLQKLEIIIPGRRMKGRAAPDHLIPITPEVERILRAIPRGLAGDFVFSTTGGALPMTVGSKIKNRLDEIIKFDDWRWHDIRRTARTNFSKLPIEEPVREALLAHLRQGLKKTYNLHDYAREKRDALMLWEAALARIVNTPPPASVTDLDAERSARLLA